MLSTRRSTCRRNDWESFSATPDQFLPSGDHVTKLGHYSGVHKQTGKSMRAAFAHIYALRDGEIVKFQQYADSAKFAEALT
jgi:ketosteroid isomerase-like protein